MAHQQKFGSGASPTMIDVAVVGGGPVGLFLAGLLLKAGATVRVYEQRLSRSSWSRAIGVHPPSLSALAELDLAEPLTAAGIRVRRGVAFSGNRQLASLDFGALDHPYPYILAVPQTATEQLLMSKTHAFDDAALQDGVQVTGVALGERSATLSLEASGCAHTARARWVVFADGAASHSSNRPGMHSRHKTYAKHFVMGDFADDDALGQDALLYLERAGIVESFPLPKKQRRWVIRVPLPQAAPSSDVIAKLVSHRTGLRLDPQTCTMTSGFTPHRAFVSTMASGCALVIGDAAHEISPIGGQGMNLGWLDGAHLAPLLLKSLTGRDIAADLAGFSTERLLAARRAALQAELNMTLGAPFPGPVLSARNLGIRLVGKTPAAATRIARRFSML
ncbi:NAD(P)/FAD-dependent oxidoreductase [Pseudarthrobacter sp. PS3-L1]|uniref:FAD-dependent oxidoreductase n=1 Tax=Pseudarthrobacter sp. PS3-L1 TaxID=3046207 RepID=UPI0024B8ECEE|nr:NAD(P)/FAD-dependent oxidoreductase [Pseudarthrobacter sp. PS3-L1]MDJ0320133.1 NAD(P)/FAD-dependent oxidoreductase [Pseudarthrobacter sp. PS3-L1]